MGITPFPAELEAGLGPALAAARVDAVCEVRPLPAPGLPGEGGLALATNLNQKDLYYCQTLLVSTGFNRNGHFFPAADTWAARFTPVDKPANRRHDRADIVGHATAVRAAAADGSDLPLDTAAADLPDSFHLFDTTVLYRVGKDKAATEEMATFIEELEQGAWWASMEALHDDFDYALAPAGAEWTDVDLAQVEFVRRTKDTAFLSAHLSRYNPRATNTYKGKRLGQVLRQITFAGKGFVPVPANPKSAVYSFDGKQLSGKISAALDAPPPAAGYTPPEPPTGTAMDEQLDKLKAELAAAHKTAGAAEADLAQAKADGEATARQLAEATARLAAEQAATAALAGKRDELQAELDKARADLARAQADLDAVAQERRLAALTAKVAAAYGVDADKAGAIALTLAALTDDLVEKNLAAVAGAKPAPPAEPPAKPADPPALAALEPVDPPAPPPPPAAAEAPKPTRGQAARDSILAYARKQKAAAAQPSTRTKK
jgi:hypothetical protein